MLEIVCRQKVTRNGALGWVLGVVPPSQPPPLPFRQYLAVMQQQDPAVDPEAVKRRWRAGLDWYVAADPLGERLLRPAPFRYPSSAMREGLVRRIFTPDGRPDLLPAPDPRWPGARVNPVACQVTQSTDPSDVARWWWSVRYGGFALDVVDVQRLPGSRLFLPRTERLPDGLDLPHVMEG